MENRLSSIDYPVLTKTNSRISLDSAVHQQSLTLHVLEILNNQSSANDVIREVLNEIKKQTGIEAVGIRLKEGDDYPYYTTSGFSEGFIKDEMNLCSVNDNGKLIRDNKGIVCIDCLCHVVINGIKQQNYTFFTTGGSFWTNSTSELMNKNSLAPLKIVARNRCNKEGYESVALIPLKVDNTIIGLLQLNDHRRNVFTIEIIQFFEKLSNCIGLAVTRKKSEIKLQKNEKKLLEAQKIANLGYYVFDITSGFWTSSKILDTILGIESNHLKDVSAWLDLVHPDHRDMMSNYLLYDILRQNKPFDKEYRIIDHKTGQEKWVHGLGYLKLDHNNVPIEMFGTIQDITEHKLSEKALQKSNIALKEILKTIEDEKKEQMLSVHAHIHRAVLPLVRKLEISANDLQSNYISLLKNNLESIISPFVSELETQFVNLSPREVEICKMLKDGMTSKEIAETLNTSIGTVFNQRKAIRKKLGIANNNINLVTFLKSI